MQFILCVQYVPQHNPVDDAAVHTILGTLEAAPRGYKLLTQHAYTVDICMVVKSVKRSLRTG